MSSRVPGPKARSQRRTSSARASSMGSGGIPDGNQRSIGLQRNWPLTHVPRGRPRPILPSRARWWTTREIDRHRALVRLPARQRHPLGEARVDAAQLGRRSLASLANRGKSELLQLGEVIGGVRRRTTIGQELQRPRPLALGDVARARREDHRHVRERHEEQRAAHREHAQDGRLLVERLARSTPARTRPSAPAPRGRRSPDRSRAGRPCAPRPRPATTPWSRPASRWRTPSRARRSSSPMWTIATLHGSKARKARARGAVMKRESCRRIAPCGRSGIAGRVVAPDEDRAEPQEALVEPAAPGEAASGEESLVLGVGPAAKSANVGRNIEYAGVVAVDRDEQHVRDARRKLSELRQDRTARRPSRPQRGAILVTSTLNGGTPRTVTVKSGPPIVAP